MVVAELFVTILKENMRLIITLIFFCSCLIQTVFGQKGLDCFTKYIRIELTPDIKEINCNDSIVSSFQMSFICNTMTLNRIVNKLKLIRDRKYDYKELQHIFKEYDWWRNENLIKAKRYYKSDISKNMINDGPWIMVCYDKKKSKLYFSLFDL